VPLLISYTDVIRLIKEETIKEESEKGFIKALKAIKEKQKEYLLSELNKRVAKYIIKV
jgi:hypothetical protein